MSEGEGERGRGGGGLEVYTRRGAETGEGGGEKRKKNTHTGECLHVEGTMWNFNASISDVNNFTNLLLRIRETRAEDTLYLCSEQECCSLETHFPGFIFSSG